MAKVFHEILSGGQSFPVWDETAHTDIGSLSSNLGTHSVDTNVHLSAGERDTWNEHVADTDIHVTTANKAAWDAKLDASHGENSDIHVTLEDKAAWNAKLDTDALADYYKKTETSSTGELTLALAAKQDVLNFNFDETLNRITGINNSAVGVVYTAGSGIDAEQLAAGNIQLDKEYQEAGNYVTSANDTLNNKQLVLKNNNWTELELPETTYEGDTYVGVSADDAGKVTINATQQLKDDIAEKLKKEDLIGKNGIIVEAEMNDEGDATGKTVVKLDEHKISFGRFSTNPRPYLGEPIQITDWIEEEVYGDKIKLVNDAFKLKKGFYHVDVQCVVEVMAGGEAAEYFKAKLSTSITPTRQVIQTIDGSFAHSETLSLSFDFFIAEDDQICSLTIDGLNTRMHYNIKDLNMHELVTVDGILQTEGGNYTAGDGVIIQNKAISVNTGKGLKVDPGSNMLQLALGKGLKFTQSSEVATEFEISSDEKTEEVINVVEKTQNDLDEKVTTTYSYANITQSNQDFGTFGTAQTGVLMGYLFSVPINNKIYIVGDTDEDGNPVDKTTIIGVYSKQACNVPIILGIYEYDPEYKRPDGTFGRTTALCDTGVVTLQQGLNEFEMIHFGIDEGLKKEFRAGCLYYAAIYVGRGSGNGIFLASCPGYDTTFNAKPALSAIRSNINIVLDKNARASVSFNQFGFSWGGNEEQGWTESPSLPRAFMQFRNKKNVV